MANRNLIQIAQDSAALEELLQETGGELTETVENFLAEVEKNVATKADSYYSVMDHLSSVGERYRKRAQAYTSAAKSAESVVDRMKERIKTAMQIMGTEEVQGETIRFKLQNSPASLVIADSTVIPQEYTVVEVKPDTTKIKSALKDGFEVPGAKLEQGKTLRSYLKK